MFSFSLVSFETKINYLQNLSSSGYQFLKLTYRNITKNPLNVLSSYLLIFSSLLPSYSAQENNLNERNYIANDNGFLIDQFTTANNWISTIEYDLKEKFDIISNVTNITDSRVLLFANHHDILDHQIDFAVFTRKLSKKNDYLLIEGVSAETSLSCAADKEEDLITPRAKKIFSHMNISGWEDCTLYKKSGRNIATREALDHININGLIEELIAALEPKNINNKYLLHKALSKTLASLEHIQQVSNRKLKQSIKKVKSMLSILEGKEETLPLSALQSETQTIQNLILQDVATISDKEEKIFNNITLKGRNKKGLINKLETLKNSKHRIFVTLGFLHVIPSSSWENKQSLEFYQQSDPQYELREYLKDKYSSILIPKMRQ